MDRPYSLLLRKSTYKVRSFDARRVYHHIHAVLYCRQRRALEPSVFDAAPRGIPPLGMHYHAAWAEQDAIVEVPPWALVRPLTLVMMTGCDCPLLSTKASAG